MSFFKPIIKTSILAALSFFIIVILGMKYHWIEKIHLGNDKQQVIPIPARSEKEQVSQTSTLQEEKNSLVKSSDKDFEPTVVTDVDYAEVIAKMDKEGVFEACTSLYANSDQLLELKELAIADCVVSNYSEPDKKTESSSSNNRQKQIQKKNATLACWKELQLGGTDYSKLEQQLLVGVCVADKLSRD